MQRPETDGWDSCLLVLAYSTATRPGFYQPGWPQKWAALTSCSSISENCGEGALCFVSSGRPSQLGGHTLLPTPKQELSNPTVPSIGQSTDEDQTGFSLLSAQKEAEAPSTSVSPSTSTTRKSVAHCDHLLLHLSWPECDQRHGGERTPWGCDSLPAWVWEDASLGNRI